MPVHQLLFCENANLARNAIDVLPVSVGLGEVCGWRIGSETASVYTKTLVGVRELSRATAVCGDAAVASSRSGL
jgi:hypothetical protein